MATTRPNRELVELSRKGDREAFEELVHRLTPRLEVQIRARMGPGVRAHLEPGDVLSETFAAALGSIDRLEWRGEESFYRWLAGIAEHVIRNASRKRAPLPLEVGEDVEAEDTSPSRNLGRKERRERLREALRRLPAPYREALELARLEGLPIEEVAARMDRSPGAVKKLLARGLRELRKRFGETESLHLPAESRADPTRAPGPPDAPAAEEEEDPR